MTDYVLWRRLTETDFNAMRGMASPYGRGGGAMHIALGKPTNRFNIDRFLRAGGRTRITIEATALLQNRERAPLSFAGNPKRRQGEWLIRDQYSHRHPAWSEAAGFPSAYNENDPPYVLIFRVGQVFHARFATASQIRDYAADAVPPRMSVDAKGIEPAPPALLALFHVPAARLIEAFEEQAAASSSEPFNPANIADGRRRIFATVLRRQGQQAFRGALLNAYRERCAMTASRTVWVLEAAHISPYRGRRTNSTSNGLLLRADIHTLFDLGLISIEPNRRKIRVSSLLSGSDYAELNGRELAKPKFEADRPSQAALLQHYSLFRP
ncbi:MAG: HNH endonuclease [Alphaproteobacteria bacterium]